MFAWITVIYLKLCSDVISGIEVNHLVLERKTTNGDTKVEYMDVTGPKPIIHYLKFDYSLKGGEVESSISVEKDSELLIALERQQPGPDKLTYYQNYTDVQIGFEAVQAGKGMITFRQPSSSLEGLYTVTVRVIHNVTNLETVGRYRTQVKAFSNCTQMNVDSKEEPSRDNGCQASVHFFCQEPVYPPETITKHHVEWTSPNVSSFFVQDPLEMNEFETLPDGRIKFDFKAAFQIRSSSPPMIQMRFEFSQLDDLPMINHTEMFHALLDICQRDSNGSSTPGTTSSSTRARPFHIVFLVTVTSFTFNMFGHFKV